MNERELLYIKTIADEKSISKAAKKLFVAQPSLSQAVQKIEEEIGAKLFIRNPDGMTLTFAGEKYYLTATEILNIYDDFRNEITYINDLVSGRITFGITGFLGTYMLPDLINRYSKKHPNIEIYVKELTGTEIEKSLLNGSIDFGIMHTHPLIDNSCIKNDILFRDPFVIVTKKGQHIIKKFKTIGNHPYPFININFLKDEKFVLLEKSKRIRQICDIIFNTARINPNVALALNNFETARRIASTGYGITMIPLSYIKIFEGQYEADYYMIENENAFWDTCISTNPNMYMSKASKEFINLIYEYFENSQPI
ncbi:MAG: transcriptional regulator, LysR family [Bacillota bacterium]|jgi:DNA-binding transcriptional LysR family regulator|nr:transcriptional regulator, LysR family [Bacillota bacterium]